MPDPVVYTHRPPSGSLVDHLRDSPGRFGFNGAGEGSDIPDFPLPVYWRGVCAGIYFARSFLSPIPFKTYVSGAGMIHRIFTYVLLTILLTGTFRSSSEAAETWEVIGYNTNDNPRSTEVKDVRLEEARLLTKDGATRYFVGLGIEYGIITPLSFVQINSDDMGLAFLGLGLSIGSAGLQMSGGIRAGVGASLAYDYGTELHTVDSRNINWGFYKAGWALEAVNNLVGIITFVTALDYASSRSSGDTDLRAPQSLAVLSIVSLTLSIASDAMFITSVANSLKYTKQARYRKSAGRLEFNLQPTFTAKGDLGAQLVCRF